MGAAVADAVADAVAEAVPTVAGAISDSSASACCASAGIDAVASPVSSAYDSELAETVALAVALASELADALAVPPVAAGSEEAVYAEAEGWLTADSSEEAYPETSSEDEGAPAEPPHAAKTSTNSSVETIGPSAAETLP